MILLCVGISLSALAGGPRVTGSGVKGGVPHSKVVIVSPRFYGSYAGFGYGYAYNPFFSPFAYNSFYYPYNVQPSQPSKLDLEIEQINTDYRHDVADIRHDNTLSSSERKQKIRDLQHDKQSSILDAKQKYYNERGDDTIE